MKEKEQAALGALFHRFHPESPFQLLHHFQPQEQGPLGEVRGKGIECYLTSIEDRLAQIHYSWMTDWISRQPHPLWPYYIAALPEIARHPAARLLDSPEPLPTLSPLARKFLLHQLYPPFEDEAILPVELLNEPPLDQLLHLSKQELVRAIGLLGLYDLAAALRRVLEAEKHEKIRSMLPPGVSRFLDRCLTQQDPLPPPALRLERWQGGERQLARLCQQFGLRRLGGALSTSSPSLIWHLTRRLDTQRGHRLEEEAARPFELGLQRALSQQSRDAVQFLSKL